MYQVIIMIQADRYSLDDASRDSKRAVVTNSICATCRTLRVTSIDGAIDQGSGTTGPNGGSPRRVRAALRLLISLPSIHTQVHTL